MIAFALFLAADAARNPTEPGRAPAHAQQKHARMKNNTVKEVAVNNIDSTKNGTAKIDSADSFNFAVKWEQTKTFVSDYKDIILF